MPDVARGNGDTVEIPVRVLLDLLPATRPQWTGRGSGQADHTDISAASVGHIRACGFCAVVDDHHCQVALAGPLMEVGDDLLLGDGIDRAGSAVQDQNPGVAQNRACQGDPLPLPAR